MIGIQAEIMELVTTTSALRQCCERFRQEAFVAVDTEFMRETTYWPKLCLIQVAGEHDVALVDSLAEGLELEPFFELMDDANVTKVFHAARQDLEIIWHRAKRMPYPIVDTQVAAMVLGFGDQIAYDQLVQRMVGAKIDKTNRFTDWSRRPLSDAQLEYAAADVVHLRALYPRLVERLEKRERSAWVNDEMAFLTAPSTYDMDPERAWIRLKARPKSQKEQAVLMTLAAWREREAQGRDMPRGRIIKDDLLLEISSRMPRDETAMRQIRGIPQGFERSRIGTELLALIDETISRDPATLPPLPAAKSNMHSPTPVVDLLKVLLKKISEESGVASKIIATVDDLEAIACDDAADVSALSGWRRSLFGERALMLKKGQLALAIERDRVILIERPEVKDIG